MLEFKQANNFMEAFDTIAVKYTNLKFNTRLWYANAIFSGLIVQIFLIY